MLKLLQRQVAEEFGVNAATIHNWEANIVQPERRYLPAIIRFLGYNPLPPPSSDGWGARLVSCHTALGISQRKLAVDPSTLAKWERGEREPKDDVYKA